MTAAAAAALLTALTGCSVLGGGEGDAAREAAQTYVDLVAAGDDPQALWAMTLTEDPASVRDAGRMLAGASERIEVLSVGEAGPAQTPLPALYESDLDTEEARQVLVSYRLAGAEHEATVLLAPHENQPSDEPGSWVVVDPLLGGMTVPPVAFGAAVPATYVGGVHAQVGDDHSEQSLPLYPAVYAVQERADPYLSSTPVELAVVAGPATTAPEMTLAGTEETAAALTADLVDSLQRCHADAVACAHTADPLVEARGIDPLLEEWSFEVTTPPELTLEGTQAEFTGGVLVVHGPGGEQSEVPFEGTVPWSFDPTTWTPIVLGYEMEIREVER